MTNNSLTPSQEAREAADYLVEMVEDRPTSGMWHCGPNAAWVTVTHLPTMISARAFDEMHHKAKQAAMACCEMMVEQSRLLKCQFPERVATDEAAIRKDEAEQCAQFVQEFGPSDVIGNYDCATALRTRHTGKP